MVSFLSLAAFVLGAAFCLPSVAATDEVHGSLIKGNVQIKHEGADTGPDPSSSVLVRFEVQHNAADDPPSTGSFVIEVNPSWSPLGAQRFLDLVDGNGPDGQPDDRVSGDAFWNGLRFFRVVDRFMAQFGIGGNPEVSASWRGARIVDDPVVQSNQRGYISFATSGKDSRTTQMFINYKDNHRLDKMGFSPFGRVVEGMAVVDAIYKGYGETPSQGLIQSKGNEYLEANFPNLSYVTSVKRVDSLEGGVEEEDEEGLNL